MRSDESPLHICGRPAKFFLKDVGIQQRKNHDLCFKCRRALYDKLRNPENPPIRNKRKQK